MLQIRLKELREKKGISQAELAKKMGVVQSTVGMWESGKNQPQQSTLVALANFFDVSVEYLLGLSDSQKPEYAMIAEKLGLTGKSIKNIASIKAETSNQERVILEPIDVLNGILSSSNLLDFLLAIRSFLLSRKIDVSGIDVEKEFGVSSDLLFSQDKTLSINKKYKHTKNDALKEEFLKSFILSFHRDNITQELLTILDDLVKEQSDLP